MINYYEILEINQKATKEQVKEAYRKISLRVHPDKNGGDEFYTEIFKVINEARLVLTDEVKRAEYDEGLFRSYKYNYRFGSNIFGINIQGKRNQRLVVGFIVAIVAFLIFIILSPSADLKLVERQSEYAKLQSTDRLLNKVLVAKDKASVSSSHTPLIDNNTVGKERLLSTDSRTAKKMKAFFKMPADSALGGKPENSNGEVVLPTHLSEIEMVAILERLDSLNATTENKINCVKILKTRDSNVENAFELAEFFQSEGFTIAGRETVKANVQGVEVKGGEQCFYVTIGRY
jgi:hypothetical protein